MIRSPSSSKVSCQRSIVNCQRSIVKGQLSKVSCQKYYLSILTAHQKKMALYQLPPSSVSLSFPDRTRSPSPSTGCGRRLRCSTTPVRPTRCTWWLGVCCSCGQCALLERAKRYGGRRTQLLKGEAAAYAKLAGVYSTSVLCTSFQQHPLGNVHRQTNYLSPTDTHHCCGHTGPLHPMPGVVFNR